MVLLLDASFLIAFDNLEDIHHVQARELWGQIKEEDYFISDYIFDEIVGIISRKKGKDRTIIFGNKILEAVPIINIDHNLFEEAWKMFKETKLNLSFTDCTSLALLKLMKINRIATFDKAFEKIGWIAVFN